MRNRIATSHNSAYPRFSPYSRERRIIRGTLGEIGEPNF